MLRRVLQTYRRAWTGLPRPVWLLAGAVFVNRAGTMVLPFLSLWITQVKHHDPATAGTLLGAYGLGAILGALLGGRMSDRFGPLRVQIATLVMGACGFQILGLMDGAAEIAAALFFLALVAEGFRPANAAMLTDLAPAEQRSKAWALNRLAINLGMSIGPVLGGKLAGIDYHWLFRVDAITNLMAAIWLAAAFRSLPRRAKAAAAVSGARPESRARSPLSDRRLLLFLACSVPIMALFFQIDSSFALYLKTVYGLDEGAIGSVFAFNTVTIVLVEMVVVDQLRHLKLARVLPVGATIVGAGLFLLPFGSSYAWAVACVLLITFGEMATFPLMGGHIGDMADESSRGRYLGLYSTTFAITFALAPKAGLTLYGAAGPERLFQICGLVGILSAASFIILGKRIGGSRECRPVEKEPNSSSPSP